MALLSQLSSEISKILETILPSIVVIRAYSKPKRKPWDILKGKKDLELLDECTGAGVIISSNGLIITNSHVVEGADKISVELHDERSFEAESCRFDPISDIGMLKVPAIDLPAADYSNDRSVRRGEIVFAVGHPFEFTSSVTMGIVSAPARFELSPSGRPSVYIQTDAAINEGNSGGALVGCDGKVIGIVTGGVDPFMAQGLAFAIPIKTAIKVSEKLAKGPIIHVDIGVSGFEFDLPAGVVAKHRLRQSSAPCIGEVKPDGPADKAGIEVGDWIIRINDHPIESLEAFLDMLDESLVGKDIVLQVIRGSDLSLAQKRLQVEDLEME